MGLSPRTSTPRVRATSSPARRTNSSLISPPDITKKVLPEAVAMSSRKDSPVPDMLIRPPIGPIVFWANELSARNRFRLSCLSRESILTFEGRLEPSNVRSEEHTSELQSLRHLVCRL